MKGSGFAFQSIILTWDKTNMVSSGLFLIHIYITCMNASGIPVCVADTYSSLQATEINQGNLDLTLKCYCQHS